MAKTCQTVSSFRPGNPCVRGVRKSQLTMSILRKRNLGLRTGESFAVASDLPPFPVTSIVQATWTGHRSDNPHIILPLPLRS